MNKIELEIISIFVRLADLLNKANNAYHGDDNPIMTDAEFDFLKMILILIF